MSSYFVLFLKQTVSFDKTVSANVIIFRLISKTNNIYTIHNFANSAITVSACKVSRPPCGTSKAALRAWSAGEKPSSLRCGVFPRQALPCRGGRLWCKRETSMAVCLAANV